MVHLPISHNQIKKNPHVSAQMFIPWVIFDLISLQSVLSIKIENIHTKFKFFI